MKKSAKKRGVHSGPKDASSAYLFFIRVRVRLKLRVRVRAGVTELVNQIGFTTLFRSQGRENILAAAAASSSKQQAATELISAYPHISINLDGTSPKLSRYIVLMMPYNHTKFQVKTHQGAGSVGKKG